MHADRSRPVVWALGFASVLACASQSVPQGGGDAAVDARTAEAKGEAPSSMGDAAAFEPGGAAVSDGRTAGLPESGSSLDGPSASRETRPKEDNARPPQADTAMVDTAVPLQGALAVPADPCSYPSTRTVNVINATEIAAAFAAAQPGDLIRIADGTHDRKNYALARSGAAGKPIVVCGTRKAVLATRDGNALYLTGSHVVLSGFSITGGNKGLILDGANNCLLSDIEVARTQEEGIHFRSHSANNILRGSHIHDTGLGEAGYGEGVYVGSADTHWGTYTNGEPDRSDNNQILGNHIDRTAAEAIDVKEGTVGGRIIGNVFGGSAIAAENFADSFIDMKGNKYLVEGNRALTEGNNKIVNGFEVHGKPNAIPNPPYGHDNVFLKNQIDGTMPGTGFYVDRRTQRNVVACDNNAPGAVAGKTNVTCQ